MVCLVSKKKSTNRKVEKGDYVALKMNNNAIAIIGGVDGPTSVFVAGKLNSVLVSILLIAIGVVMLIVAIIFYFLKKK